MKQIPEKGVPEEILLQKLKQRKKDDIKWAEGRCWSLIYQVDEAHSTFLKKASNLYLTENYVNPLAFKSLREMEQEIIQMSASLFNGNEQTVGTVTSGGTESIFLSVYTYREKAAKTRPEIILTTTAHPAFEKAAYILGIKVKKAKLNANYRVDIQSIKKLISAQTMLIVVSAPNYPHGLIDPVSEVAQLARKRNIPLHVDACLGGFLLPWLEALKVEVPVWDFRLEGVTSISADLHKFGYGIKGASVILYRSMRFLKHQFYINPNWPGGIFAAPTLLGSRSGAAIAGAWAALNKMGKEGYKILAKKALKGFYKMKDALEAIPEIELIGQPQHLIIAYRTKNNEPDIYVIADQLEAKAWLVDRQQFPPSIHLTVMVYNVPYIDQYLADLKEALEYAKVHPEAASKGNAALYGLMTRIPFKGMVKDNIRKVFMDLYANAPAKEEEYRQQAEPKLSPWLARLNRFLKQAERLFKRTKT